MAFPRFLVLGMHIGRIQWIRLFILVHFAEKVPNWSISGERKPPPKQAI